MLKPSGIISLCPQCSQPLTYVPSYPGDFYNPPEPEDLYCEHCFWEPEDITDYYLYPED